MNTLFKTVTDSDVAQENDKKIVTLQQSQFVEQTIFIKNLELDMSIGVFDVEKEEKQRVVVDIELTVVPSINWKADNIDDVVSYAAITDEIKSLAEQKHINLVETFAEMIIEKCFTYASVLAVNVSVEKPNIMQASTSVGVQISRSRY